MSRSGSVALPNREDPDAGSKLQSVRARYLNWKSEGWDNQMHWYSAKDLAAFARNSKLFADEIYEVEMTHAGESGTLKLFHDNPICFPT
jgi:hypothetical protein